MLLAAFLICNWQLLNVIQRYVHHWRKTRTLLHKGRWFHFSDDETPTRLLFLEFTDKLVGLINFSLFLRWTKIGFSHWWSLISHAVGRLARWNHWCLLWQFIGGILEQGLFQVHLGFVVYVQLVFVLDCMLNAGAHVVAAVGLLLHSLFIFLNKLTLFN